MAFIALATVFQIVVLSPASIEQPLDPAAPVDPALFAPPKSQESPPKIQEIIPQGRVPDYTIDKFNYVSTQAGVKQWRIDAATADLFNDIKIVHSRQITAYLLDPDGQATVVTGREGLYHTEKRDLEIFGDVVTVMPDGFEIHSEYLMYQPDEKRVLIPTTYPTTGGDGPKSKKSEGQKLSFSSQGLDYRMGASRIILPQDVEVRSVSPNGERTSIRSDHCVVHRDVSMAFFTMLPARPDRTRYVTITQPTLISRGRRADLQYGDKTTGKNALNYLVVHEDVLLRETGTHELKYATAGQAAFDSRKNDVILTEFPQVYQGDDTVTGDVILLHRDTDVVEVERSNAYSRGITD